MPNLRFSPGSKAEALDYKLLCCSSGLHNQANWCISRHLALGWANVEPDTPVKAGTRFCICYKELIPWVMLPLQIAYVTDGNGSNSSGHGKGGVFAFGSGTLQGHLLAGEERFSVQLDEDDQVWYEVMSFSKPAHILSSLCYPYVQLRQRHFAHQSGQALLRHVASRSQGTR